MISVVDVTAPPPVSGAAEVEFVIASVPELAVAMLLVESVLCDEDERERVDLLDDEVELDSLFVSVGAAVVVVVVELDEDESCAPLSLVDFFARGTTGRRVRIGVGVGVGADLVAVSTVVIGVAVGGGPRAALAVATATASRNIDLMCTSSEGRNPTPQPKAYEPPTQFSLFSDPLSLPGARFTCNQG